MAGDDEDIVPEDVSIKTNQTQISIINSNEKARIYTYFYLQFANLILDDTKIPMITEEDGKYLNTFKNLERLSMNATGLKSLDNLPPDVKMIRVSKYSLY